MQDAKEEVRARLGVEDVIGDYVELKRAGRNLKGLSPFSSEKTPSFMVSPEKQIWHDFSSGKGGDIFTFVMEIEGMTFRESLEHLARKAGVDLSMYDSPGKKGVSEKRRRLVQANKLAQNYFQHSLLKNKHAVEYVFYKRNLNRQTVQEFCIGYAPDATNALTDYLAKKGFAKRELDDAGLTNRYGGDLFKARMMVPLMDSVGETIGFTARVISDTNKATPKYLNTRQTLIYDKGRHVFGLSQAKETIKKVDYAVVVEGNLDVVSSHQAGVKQAVATAGTAITEHHLKAIARFSNNVRLAFDMDAAGLAAAERAVELAQKTGVELSIVSLGEEAKDPDELIQKDPELWQKAIDSHQPAVDWLLGQYEAKLDLTTAAGKREYSSVAVKLINNLTDPIVKDHYFKLVSARLKSSIEALKKKSLTAGDTSQRRLKRVSDAVKTGPDENGYQDNILAIVLVYKKLRKVLNVVDPSDFFGDNRQKLVAELKIGQAELDRSDANQDNYLSILKLRAEGRYEGWSDTDIEKELHTLLSQLELHKLKTQKDALFAALKDAEVGQDASQIAELLKQINQLNKEIGK
ncbi:MAG: DNA primase [Candidatus Nomurabacteria bacterium]|jgi:DNA primase|nr:DNA primase [Candidatus Nomurabacteria bacterium]